MKDLLREAKEILEEYSLYTDYIEIHPTVLQNFFSLKGVLTIKKGKDSEQTTSHQFANFATIKDNTTANSFLLKNQNSLFPDSQDTNEWQTSSSLDELQQKICNCRKCKLADGRTNFVFGEGNPNAELMFIGEGPGRDEDLQGRPFVGKAGQLLTRMIAAMGYNRQEVYIANVVKCRPPDNRVPEKEEAEQCLPYLKRQIELVKPKVIILLGATPARYILNANGINEVRGKWFTINDIKVMPTYHPAFLLRNPSAKSIVWADLKLVMKFLGKKI